MYIKTRGTNFALVMEENYAPLTFTTTQFYVFLSKHVGHISPSRLSQLPRKVLAI